MSLSLENIIPMVAIFYGKVFRICMKQSKNFVSLNLLMHKVPKWPDTLKTSCSQCCKVFKVSLTILGHYKLKAYVKLHFFVQCEVNLLNQYIF